MWISLLQKKKKKEKRKKKKRKEKGNRLAIISYFLTTKE